MNPKFGLLTRHGIKHTCTISLGDESLVSPQALLEFSWIYHKIEIRIWQPKPADVVRGRHYSYISGFRSLPQADIMPRQSLRWWKQRYPSIYHPKNVGQSWAWRVGSVVNSTCFFSRGPMIHSQYLHDSCIFSSRRQEVHFCPPQTLSMQVMPR